MGPTGPHEWGWSISQLWGLGERDNWGMVRQHLLHSQPNIGRERHKFIWDTT